jgi:phosphoribosylanthranilate isomerase
VSLVKVCGLTNPADAAFAAAAGADLLGFVVHPPSPRHCPRLSEASREAGGRAVLVMVSEDADLLAATADEAGIRRIQAHVAPPRRAFLAEQLRARGFELLLPWPDEGGQEPCEGGLYLWESSPARTGLAGGSGQPHAMAFPPPGPFLLAGGLSAENLAERVDAMSPAARLRLRGFDAASGLEKIPGRKDPDKVRAFIRAARAVETLDEP